MIDLNIIGTYARTQLFWYTPYRTGNLARNGVSDFGFVSGGVGWTMFGKGTEYGAILNEQQIITYRRKNTRTGVVYEHSYQNRHYMWLDNFAEEYASLIPIYFSNIRRIQ